MKCFKKMYWFGWFVSLFVVSSCVHDPLVVPENPDEVPAPGCTPSKTVCFESTILPIFTTSCAMPNEGCHDAKEHKEGFVLDSYANIMKKGIVKGSANESKIYEVLFESGNEKMPRSPAAPLTQAQKDSIKLWINQGANYTTDCNCYCDETQFTFQLSIKPIIDKCEGCHNPGVLKGNVNLSTYEAILVSVNNGALLGSITHDSNYIPMPYPSGKLSDCEIEQITNWINAGALNN